MGLKRTEEKPAKINPRQILEEKRSYSDRVQKDLEEKGVVLFRPDGGCLNIDDSFLVLPRNITDATPRDLGEHLNAYTQQKMYMRTLLGWAECFLDEAQQEYSIASDSKYKELSKTKMSETAKEREVNSDPLILPTYEKYMELKRRVQVLNQNLKSIEDAIFLISREVSRRTGDFNNELRNSNVNK